MRTNRRGLTLIEVLVGVAILAIIAAIVYPVLAKARYNNQVAYAKAHGLPLPPPPFKEDHSDADASRTGDSRSTDSGSGNYQQGFVDGYSKGHAAGFADGLKAGEGSRQQ